MKAELMDIEGKGVCIVISELDTFALSQQVATGNGRVFTDINAIVRCILERKKIHAIKEIRHQTGMSLKEAKEYIEKYVPYGSNAEDDWTLFADKFRREHVPFTNFLNEREFEL